MEGIRSFVHQGRLTWTMTTNGYKFYTLNLISWLRDVAKVPWQLCVICCDRESYSFFRREGMSCILYDGKTMNQQRIASFDTQEFSRIVRKKLDLLLWISQHDKELGIEKSLYIDGDIVVQHDPWPVLEGLWAQGAKDLLFQCDCANSDEHTDCGVACTGVIVQKHGGLDLTNVWKIEETTWKESSQQDQVYVNRKMKELEIPYGMLPRPEWGNGTWQKSLKWKNHDWVLLHYNFRVGDTKKAAMKSYGHWRIPY